MLSIVGTSELVDWFAGGVVDDTVPIAEGGAMILGAASVRRIANCNTSEVTFLETFRSYDLLS
jgi:hypothetical protein